MITNKILDIKIILKTYLKIFKIKEDEEEKNQPVTCSEIREALVSTDFRSFSVDGDDSSSRLNHSAVPGELIK